MTTPQQLLRDPEWVKRNSRWRYWAWTLGFLTWVGFIWIGYRARKQRWIVYGLLYGVPFAAAMALTDQGKTAQSIADNVVTPIMVILGIIGIFHARRLLPEYLAIRAQVESSPSYTATPEAEAAQRLGLTADASAGASAPAPGLTHPLVAAAQADRASALAVSPAPAPRPAPAPGSAPAARPVSAPTLLAATASPTAPVDVNTATEQQLADLPGVGVVLAKRAVDVRARSGPFASIDAFGHALDLKPHVLERLRPRVTATAPPRSDRARGRVVDF